MKACITVLILAVAMSAAEPPEAMQHARASYERAKQGDLAGAADEMRVAIRLAPENPLYLSALGGIAARQWEAGQSVQARENAAIVADAQPGNTKARELLEEISLDLGAELAKSRRFKAGLTLAQDTAEEVSCFGAGATDARPVSHPESAEPGGGQRVSEGALALSGIK